VKRQNDKEKELAAILKQIDSLAMQTNYGLTATLSWAKKRVVRGSSFSV